MSGFTADWLTLREPYDVKARSESVLKAVVESLRGLPSVRIVDIACGTGSTLRTLAPRLQTPQHWRLADNDLSLLARAAETKRPPGVAVDTVPLDLNRDLEAVLDGALDLLTASALLDLVSESWLERLTVEAAARAIPVYAALNYDGRIEFGTPDPQDKAMIAAVNAHQRTDKGFGPALGPLAASSAAARFEKFGYTVIQERSDWLFGPDDSAIQFEILAGWASAARDIATMPLEDIAGWLVRRRDAVAAKTSSIRVGHVDVFARPAARR